MNARIRQGAQGTLAFLRSTKAKLMLTGFVQVVFVAINTVAISAVYSGDENATLLNAVTAFSISFVWTYNVRKIAFGGTGDQVAYSTGAMFGSVTGSHLASYILRALS